MARLLRLRETKLPTSVLSPESVGIFRAPRNGEIQKVGISLALAGRAEPGLFAAAALGLGSDDAHVHDGAEATEHGPLGGRGGEEEGDEDEQERAGVGAGRSTERTPLRLTRASSFTLEVSMFLTTRSNV